MEDDDWKPIKPEEPKKGLNSYQICAIVFFVGMVFGMAIIALPVEFSGNYITAPECNSSINESFYNGIAYGQEYTVAAITQEVIQCKKLPMSYGNYSYTLIAEECLNISGVNV